MLRLNDIGTLRIVLLGWQGNRKIDRRFYYNLFTLDTMKTTLFSKHLTSYRQQFCHFSTKTHPGFFNTSVSISIAHQLIDILKFSVCHFHYIMRVKSSEWKNCFKWDSNLHLQRIWTAAVLPLMQNH